jgi:hypothetical protein
MTPHLGEDRKYITQTMETMQRCITLPLSLAMNTNEEFV